MKQATHLTLLLLIIPFFIVLFLLKEKIDNKMEEQKEEKVYVNVKREKLGRIDKVELEDYVVGVLAGEMPTTFHIESLKAQAVAARSYVLKRLEYNKEKEYDVVDTVMNQVYLDNEYLKERWKDEYQEKILKLKRVVEETRLEYISYEGKIADALFFSTSNGRTENSEEIFSFKTPYLRSVESAWDEKTSPVFKDQKTFFVSEFYQILEIEKNEQLTIEIISESSTGRVLNLKINGVEMNGSDVAKKLGLRSNDFEIIEDNDQIIINTNGYGHGVGMSQYGALGMAMEGYSYDKILKHYYKGITIEKLKKSF